MERQRVGVPYAQIVFNVQTVFGRRLAADAENFRRQHHRLSRTAGKRRRRVTTTTTNRPVYARFANRCCLRSQGTYVSKGYDLSDLGSRLNIPKTFFYGVYKMRVYFTDQREKVYGCGIFVIAVKRPWETE